MARKTVFAPGEFYHLYNRGTDKRTIFSTKRDYERFVSLLYLCNGSKPVHIENLLQTKSKQGLTLLGMLAEVDRGQPLVEIGAYCLMPNHFHLIVREIQEGGISLFMQKLTTAYTMYYNRRQKRTGALFCGTFKAKHANKDRYLAYLIAYIHLNPVKLIDPKWKEKGVADKKRAEAYVSGYQYSSYLDFCGEKRIEGIILHKETLSDYFKTHGSFRKNINEWLSYKSDERPDGL